MREQLKFDKRFYPPIVRGGKKLTTRTKLKEWMKPGVKCDAVFVKSNGELSDYKLPIKITDITLKRFKDLSHRDAEREDCLSVRDLRETLKSIYHYIQEDDIIYCIHFATTWELED